MRRISAFLRRHLPMMLGALLVLALVAVVWIFLTPIVLWLRAARSVDTVAFLGEHLLALTILGACLVVLALIWLPKRQASRVQGVKDRLTIENATRQTLAQIVGGTVLIAGLYFTWSSLEVSREGQVTERFTKAIDQLGAVNDKGEKQLEIRLGGIYALERISRDSAKDHETIMEILTAYVREHAPWSLSDSEERRPSKLTMDIRAVLTVLGRRAYAYGKGEKYHLNLAHTNLLEANLQDAPLQGVRFMEAQLEGADLTDAKLQGADLTGAYLQRATLEGAQLESARLKGAQLQGADLRKAKLQRADLSNANLMDASLAWANLTGAVLQGATFKDGGLPGANLTKAQLQHVNFVRTNLMGVNFTEASLQGATLRDAELAKADLKGAQLEGAFLMGANLQGVKNLTLEQLSTVKSLYHAQLDLPLFEQIQRLYPQLLGRPQD